MPERESQNKYSPLEIIRSLGDQYLNSIGRLAYKDTPDEELLIMYNIWFGLDPLVREAEFWRPLLSDLAPDIAGILQREVKRRGLIIDASSRESPPLELSAGDNG